MEAKDGEEGAWQTRWACDRPLQSEGGPGSGGRRVREEGFADLAQSAPEGLRYATFQAEDGVSFTHVVSFETEEGNDPFGSTPAFEQFQADLKDRCEEPPVATFVSLVGSYKFLE